MLIQLHHQFRDNKTEMQAQREEVGGDELRTWVKEIQESHPLPEKAQWLMCNEKSEYFVQQVQGDLNG